MTLSTSKGNGENGRPVDGGGPPAVEEAPALVATDVVKQFPAKKGPSVTALNHVSLSAMPGQFLDMNRAEVS